MATYLLTWNPERWKWRELPAAVSELEDRKILSTRWSTGNTQCIEPGDRLFLLRQGIEPRGIMGSGFATSTVFSKKHFESELAAQGKMAWRVNLDFDVLIDSDANPKAVLTLDELRTGSLAAVHWHTPASGISIPEDAAKQLEILWKAKLAGGSRVVTLAEEVEKSKHLYEGALQTIQINVYERNPAARRACIAHWGAVCSVCKFDFEKVYGRLGRGFVGAGRAGRWTEWRR